MRETSFIGHYRIDKLYFRLYFYIKGNSIEVRYKKQNNENFLQDIITGTWDGNAQKEEDSKSSSLVAS